MLENTPKMGTVADVCALLLVKAPSVFEMVRNGVLPRAAKGQYDLIACNHAYIRYLRERGQAGDGSDEGLTSQRARLTRNKADMAEMERSRLLGELLPANETRAAWSSLFALLRSRFLAIPSKCAPRLLMLKTAAQPKAILEAEINEALEDVSDIEIRRTAPRAPGAGADMRGRGRRAGTRHDQGSKPAADPDGVRME
jgi:phage terminase Nu1 subunit (DNA packaging protein)